MKKAYRSLNITEFDEAVPVAHHQANGAPEVTVQILATD